MAQLDGTIAFTLFQIGHLGSMIMATSGTPAVLCSQQKDGARCIQAACSGNISADYQRRRSSMHQSEASIRKIKTREDAEQVAQSVMAETTTKQHVTDRDPVWEHTERRNGSVFERDQSLDYGIKCTEITELSVSVSGCELTEYYSAL